MDFQGIKNFVSGIKQNIENFLSKSNITSSDIIRLVSCFGIGFLLGLFLKRYVKYFVIFLIAAVLLLSVLHYFNFIVIQYAYIKNILGFSETETFDAMMSHMLTAMRIHVIEIGCVILGCLLGFKVG